MNNNNNNNNNNFAEYSGVEVFDSSRHEAKKNSSLLAVNEYFDEANNEEMSKNSTPTSKKLKNVVVIAGAGTGKTYTLVHEYLYTILGIDGSGEIHHPSRVYAVTFTEKAAAEMKSRVSALISEIKNGEIDESINEQLKKTGSHLPSKAELEKIQRALSSAPISTFHALCRQLIKELAFYSDINPNFEILLDPEYGELLQQSTEDVVLGQLNEHNQELSHLAARFRLRKPYGGQGLIEELSSLYRSLLERGVQAEDLKLGIDLNSLTQGLKQSIHQAKSIMGELFSLLKDSTFRYKTEKEIAIKQAFLELSAALKKYELEPTKNSSNDDEIIFCFNALMAEKGQWGGKAVKESRDAFFTEIQKIASYLIDDRVFAQSDICRHLIGKIHTRFQDELQTRGYLGFGDMLLYTEQLLRHNTEARAHIKKRLDKLFVDEYQDTSPIQEELVALLAENIEENRILNDGEAAMDKLQLGLGRLFIVGDPKQSIYGFRGADARLFKHTTTIICEGNEHVKATGEKRYLNINRRSNSSVISLINLISENSLSKTEFGVDFEKADHLVPLESGDDSDKLKTTSAGAFLTPLDATGNTENDEAAMIAHKISALLKENDPFKKGEDLRPKHVAVLIRTIAPSISILRALEHMGIPAIITGGRGFYERPEVVDLICCLQLLLFPNDDLAALSVLRGPIIALKDENLMRLSAFKSNEDTLWKRFKYALNHLNIEKEQIERFLYIDRLFEDLRQKLSHQSLTHVFDIFVRQSDYTLYLSGTEQEQVRLLNIEKLRSQLKGDKYLTVSRLWSFLDKPPKESLASVLEAGVDAVQIMTIHQSKGLEFPVVFLADMAKAMFPNRDQVAFDPDVGMYLSSAGDKIEQLNVKTADIPQGTMNQIKNKKKLRETAELARVFYVALTRAKERLYLLGEEKRKSFSLRRILEESRAQFREKINILLPNEQISAQLGPKVLSQQIQDMDVERFEQLQLKKEPEDDKQYYQFQASALIHGIESNNIHLDYYAKKKGRLNHSLLEKLGEDLDSNSSKSELQEKLDQSLRLKGEIFEESKHAQLFENVLRIYNNFLLPLVDEGYHIEFEKTVSAYINIDNNECEIKGIIDIYAENDELIRIIEMKTTRGTAEQEKTALQLYSYAYAVAQDDDRPIEILSLGFDEDDVREYRIWDENKKDILLQSVQTLINEN